MKYVILALIAGVVVLVTVVLLRNRRYPPMKVGEILPAGEMKAKYGLTIERYTPPDLDPIQVPESLRDLLPLARKWGIGDDIIRYDMQGKVSKEDKEEFHRLYNHRGREVNEWLSTYNGRMTKEAAAFMFMSLAYDELRLYTPPKP
jgi:hypothetical protein